MEIHDLFPPPWETGVTILVTCFTHDVSYFIFFTFRCILQDCVVYTGATVEGGSKLQYCLVGPHHNIPSSTTSNHQLHAETTENVITLG